MRTPLLFAVILLAPLGAAAQEPATPRPAPFVESAFLGEGERAEPRSPFEDAVETDRGSFTPSARTVEAGRLVVEADYSFADNRRAKETHSFPELLLRYGLCEGLELRLGWNYEVGPGPAFADEQAFSAGGPLQSESSLLLGFKAQLSKQDGWKPESSFFAQTLLPTHGAIETEWIFAGIVGWELPERWRLDAALRYGTDREEGDRFTEWAPSAVLKIPLGERWNLHGEWFGIWSQGKAEGFGEQYLSPGLHHFVTPDLEVGVRVGWGLNHDSDRFFANVGVAARF